jgi:DNA replication protein DnaC
MPTPRPSRGAKLRRATRTVPGRTGEAALRERLQAHLIRLGIEELLDRLDELLAWARTESPSPLALLERTLGEAAGRRRERGIERRIARSGLPERKTFEAFDWAFQPKLDRAAVESLATLNFLDQRDDLLITGKCGTGKSHILKALTLRACHQELNVRYARCVDLVTDLFAGLADGTYDSRLRRWARADLLVVDDVGLGQIRKRDDEPTAAHALFTLFDLRHQRASTALSSNIKLSAWGKYLGDATLAAAILDRLAMNAIRIDVDGPSYRQHHARQRAERDQAAFDDSAQDD